ncbi:cucumisin-like [Iris pallida]|uniref:Cucumisin-like n=1 Tax=Iris pallida TaxID=29817 RepID=A0AAX6FF13_IRIPA|nr:cucumisin-like [Iris pallida]
MAPLCPCSIYNGFTHDSLFRRSRSREEGKISVHIVYMGERPTGLTSIPSMHTSMLNQAIGSGSSDLLIRSYERSFNGFAAKLSDEEAKNIASMEGVVSVFPSRNRQLHTTQSWNFIKFPTSAPRMAYESNVIVGMLDTGIWPESYSFSDKGIGPPPSKWKGTCKSLTNFTCNNKIIGAKYYNSDELSVGVDIASPRDSEGHGTHTASTAAGAEVAGASLYGLAEGTARGGVPSARIAVYKICWSYGCSDADILAAFDDAIADGVDIISLSVGGSFPLDYFEDSIAIGAFHSMKNGILTSNSGGNSGPGSGTIANFSPWSLSVAASTIDRRFVAQVKLGNGKAYEGVAINTFELNKTSYPLVYGGNVPNTSAGYDGSTSRYCYEGSLDTTLVNGTIVLCDTLNDGSGPLLSGAAGTVMLAGDYMDYAYSFPLPVTTLSTDDSGNVGLYINSTSKPTANILKTEVVGDSAAPYVVSFSSRGPNPKTSDILKPDLTAPGVDILAAWSPVASMSTYDSDPRSVSYNIISGTSMSCPHATGAAAYVKSFHPTWSPAAIKSALMTTAYPMSASANPDMEFGYGAGQINPAAATNPGLVYDAGEADYVGMLCGQGYTTKNLQLITGDKSSCTSANNGTVWDLNYPSFALSVASGKAFAASYNRTVTNVGDAGSSYTPTVAGPEELKITVQPTELSFGSLLEKKSYTLKVEGATTAGMLSASIVWSDGVHSVRSPIVVYTA